jgi:sugar-specific transcriptional regulator TrmB
MDTKLLKDFGLSDKESRVYVSLLELGPSVASEVAAKAKINRTTAYDILEALLSYGLISHVADSKKKSYMAEDPEQLVFYLNKKSREFKDKSQEAKEILPELKSIYNIIPRKPKVKYFEGDEGLITMYEDSLTAKTEIWSWLDINVTLDFSAEYFNEYYKRRAAKGIFIRAIVTEDSVSKRYQDEAKELLREVRMVPKEMMIDTPECYIYDDKVSYMSVRERFGVMIESKDIADAQRKLYELAWEKADEYNKKIK